MATRILNWFRGYIKVKVTGFSTERFINLCGNHNIKVWGVENHGKFYILYMNRKSFFRLKTIVKKTRTKVAIEEKYGLPFFMHRYRKRKLFFIGILLFILIIFLMSLFIWDIRVEGNYSRTTEMILSFLEKNEIEYGMKKSDICCEDIEKMLRANYNDITWASARVEGTCLIIEIKENEIDLNEEVQDEVTDLVASDDGVIMNIVTRNGKPLVKNGDTVSAGQVLISGAIPVMDDYQVMLSCDYVKADGDITLKTKCNYEYEFPLEYKKKIYTGKERYDGTLRILGKKVGTEIWKKPFKRFDVIEVSRQCKLSEFFYLPITTNTRTIKEYEIKDAIYTEGAAKNLCYQNLEKFIFALEEKGVQIIDKNVKIGVSDDKCMGKGTLIILKPQTIRKHTEEILVTPLENNEENRE